jgi:Family of unknown function (DUF6114)
MARSAPVSAAGTHDAMPRSARHAPAHARQPRRQVLAGTARRAWRGWRRSRPFWGALAVVAGGGEIAAVRLAFGGGRLGIVASFGLVIAAGLIGCGLLLVFDPVQRSLYSTAAVLLSVIGLSTVHVGGYLAGSVLGAAGGALAFAWVPAAPPAAGPPSAGLPGLTLILGEAGHPAADPVSPAGPDAGPGGLDPADPGQA